MSRREVYRRRYEENHPDWKSSSFILRDLVLRETTSRTRILDVGCGYGSGVLRPVYAAAGETYGIDPDPIAVEKNPYIQTKVVGRVERMPFQDNLFDVVVLKWVMEHLPGPQGAFTEIWRVLKPGGKIIFLTTNVWSPYISIVRTIPNRFHPALKQGLYGAEQGHTYPVCYRINSTKQIRKTLIGLGFQESTLAFNGDPSYMSFNSFLFKCACGLEYLLGFPGMSHMKVHLIGLFEKNASSDRHDESREKPTKGKKLSRFQMIESSDR